MPLHQQLICWSKSNENPIMPPGNNSCSFVTPLWAATIPKSSNSFPSVRKNIIKGLRVARIQKNSYCISLIKRWFEMKSTKLPIFKNVVCEKFRKQFNFFTCILPDYVSFVSCNFSGFFTILKKTGNEKKVFDPIRI